MINKFNSALTLALLLGYSSATFAASDIQNYCEDMRAANNYSIEWRERCIATIEVEQKYKNLAESRDRQFRDLNARAEAVIMYYELSASLKEAQNEEERESIKLKLKQICEFKVVDLVEPCEEH